MRLSVSLSPWYECWTDSNSPSPVSSDFAWVRPCSELFLSKRLFLLLLKHHTKRFLFMSVLQLLLVLDDSALTAEFG